MSSVPAAPGAASKEVVLPSATRASQGGSDLSPGWRNTIVVLPVAIIFACLALLAPPAGRPIYDWMISENHPVEMATFLLLLVGALMGFRFALQLFRRRERVVGGFYVLFAIGLLLVAGEEIAWGQSLLNFETPEKWAQINAQRETTLHNLEGFQGHNDILRFAFGFGGLVGVLLGRLLPRFRLLWPSALLLTWFAIIAGLSGVQMYVDFAPNAPLAGPLDKLGRLAEVVELLIAAAAVLYLWLNVRLARRDPA